MIADRIITLYSPENKMIIAQVEAGERYDIPDYVFVFEGSIEDFKIEYPDYKTENEL